MPSSTEKQLPSCITNSENEERVPAEEFSTTQKKFEKVLLMSALSLANILVALDTTINTTALPAITSQLHSAAGYAWIGSAYVLATAVTVPVWAKLSDIWGRKPLLLLAITVFFVGSLLCGTATTMIWLILARSFQGIGGGGISILVSICISDSFSMRHVEIDYGWN
ncbi:hypothetical protein ACMFMF_011462 [Clarireedia jacksonii]